MLVLSMVRVLNTCLRKRKWQGINIYRAFDAILVYRNFLYSSNAKILYTGLLLVSLNAWLLVNTSLLFWQNMEPVVTFSEGDKIEPTESNRSDGLSEVYTMATVFL